MKKIQILIFIIAFSSNISGQVFNEKEIEGKWKVEKVVSENSNPELKILIEGFKSSTFTFHQNRNFELSTTSKSEMFTMITSMTKGAKWKYFQHNKSKRIGSQKDKYSIMGISIKELNGQILFYIEESGIVLQMKKIE